MARRVRRLASLVALALASAPAARAFLPANLALSLVGQVASRKRVREARVERAAELEVLRTRIQAIREALGGGTTASRRAGLEDLLDLSRKVRDGVYRLDTREPLDRILEVLDRAPSKGVRRYAAEVRRNLDLARDPRSPDSRAASLLRRYRPPGT